MRADRLARALFAGALVALLVATMATHSFGGPARLMLVRVTVENPAEAGYLLNRFDVAQTPSYGEIELLLWPGDGARLEAAGVDYRVVVEDLYERDRAIARAAAPALIDMPGPDRTDYRMLSDYNAEMFELAENHPSLVRLLELPEKTLEGRTVYGVEIADNVNRADGRPTFHVDGAHHGREWPAAEFPMIFAHHLVEQFGRDPNITSLLKKLRVTIIPVVNVDGFSYSRESVQAANRTVDNNTWVAGAGNGLEAYWRKNRRSPTGVTAPVIQRNPDAYGVDPNRNYSYLWGFAGGSSDNPLTASYRGDGAFSEPETRNVRALVLSRHVTNVVTNHTYGRMVLRPWGHTAKPTPDEGFMRVIGEKMGDALGYRSLIIGSWITATGSTIDWSYAATSGFGFGTELCEDFHPPYSECVQSDYGKVMDAFLVAASAAADPAFHGVITGRVIDAKGAPVRAKLTITKQWDTPLGEANETGETSRVDRLETAMIANADGNFRWHVNPSTRPIAEAKPTEAYTLTISGPAGKVRRLRIVIERGDRVNLGTIRL